MANLNFPTSPAINDTYTFAGKTWIWTGDYWRLQQPGAINNIVIGNLTPAAGTFTTLSATGNVTGAYLYGNASTATGVSKNQTFVQETTPTNAIQGDVWINTSNGKQYNYFTDANGSQWAEMEAYISYGPGSFAAVGSNTQILFNNDGLVGASGNLTFNSSTNILSTTGNITGNYFIGNGSQLSGVVSSTSIRAQAMTMSIILGS